ncbi:DUF4173 domain-containing protein [Pedobacter punctiformis]|uniref:DUF4173 domain-containing protein n=1 Tax=Pedobacter punctiformis TaxID=3004097 RepID=A0ABT4L8V8_9SPHI|nr:DUF4173 domain-containing protein [Pedobacter sp. HCMS5-2]MCZ4244330.1 DUF4173 domain-containing protein [Pedobacter sp. HCMS5-2]
MKNKSNRLLLSALLGGLLFSFLFWEERLALNLLIYSIYLIIITYLNPEVIKDTKFKIYGLAHLLAAILVVVNNSGLTLVSYYMSLMLFIGFSHNQQLRTVFMAFFTAILQMITVPFNVIRNLSEVSIGNFNLKPVFKFVKYIFIPVVIVVIFTCLYSAASSVFAHYAETFLTNIAKFFENIFGFIFEDLSFGRFMHFCFGLMVTGGLILAFFDKSLQKIELNFKEQLFRIRRNLNQKTIWYEFTSVFTGNLLTKKLALKTELITGLISFGALNFLLLFLNGIDIWWLWLGKGKNLAETNYSAELHDGTNALIFSIALAMVVIIYFFRGNLNFYSKSKTLKVLTYVWMVQNIILIISVFIRDAYYIEYYGLTHKRIGVLVFALLCIIGLATVYLKVAKQKTLFYLFKVNGNIWFALLLVFSTINWDVLIVKYNFAHESSIAVDPDYLISLSDKTLPVLDKNREKLHATSSKAPNLTEKRAIAPETNYQKMLDQRIGYFKERYEKVSWLSWNFQDWNTAEYFGLNKK